MALRMSMLSMFVAFGKVARRKTDLVKRLQMQEHTIATLCSSLLCTVSE